MITTTDKSKNQQSAKFIIEKLGDYNVRVRQSDGYIYATDLCKACGKVFYEYLRLKATEKFLEQLFSRTGIPVVELMQIKNGGKDKGSWIHPKVAINLAQWACISYYIFFVSARLRLCL